MSPNKEEYIIVYGSFGDGNPGDDLYYYTWNQKMNRTNVRILTASKDDFASNNVYQLTKIPIEYINNAKCLIIGGGHVVARHRDLITSMAGLIDKIKIPIVVCGAGCSDGYYTENLEIYKKFFNKVSYCSVRNLASRRILHNITGKLYDVVPDVVFALEDDSSYRIKISNQKKTNVGIITLGFYGGYERSLYQLICKLIDNNYSATIINFYKKKDEQLAKAYSVLTKSGLLTFPDNAPLGKWTDVFKAFDVILAHRLHSIILALLANKPFVGYNYHPKIQELVNQINSQEDVILNDRYDAIGQYGYINTNFDCDETYDKLVEKIESNKIVSYDQYQNITNKLKIQSNRELENIIRRFVNVK